MKKNGSDQTKFFALYPSAKRGGLRRVSKFCLVTSVKPRCFKGSSLIETLIYAAILGMVAVFTTDSLLTAMKSYSNIKLSRDLNFSASVATERIINEIRLANGIDDVGSAFATSSGKLKLNTTDFSGAPTTIEFFLNGSGVFIKEGLGLPESLTASSTEILSLVFNKINSASTSSAVKMSLIIKAKNGRLERTEKFYNTAVLRGSY